MSDIKLPKALASYAPLGSTAIHEAGHAAMSFLLDRAIKSVSIAPDFDAGSAGAVHNRPIGSWFRPDIEVTRRVRVATEDEVVIFYAGMETQTAWCQQVAGCPRDWRRRVAHGASHDERVAADLAYYVCSSDDEVGAYLNWLRHRTRGQMLHFEFWPMVIGLAEQLLVTPFMKGAEVRRAMQRAALALVTDD